MGIEIDTTGFNSSIDALIQRVNAVTRDGTAKGAQLIAAQAKASFGGAHAKGSPKTSDKPQSVSGRLRGSIMMIDLVSAGPGVWRARVGPTTVYGRRIELGFHGTDSLGRNYSDPGQPPYPFLKPGLDKSVPLLEAVFAAAWGAATA